MIETAISFAVAIFILFPILHVLISERSNGKATFGWFLAVICFSWLGWVAFVLMTDNYQQRNGENS